jgi:hypothetical protein
MRPAKAEGALAAPHREQRLAVQHLEFRPAAEGAGRGLAEGLRRTSRINGR